MPRRVTAVIATVIAVSYPEGNFGGNQLLDGSIRLIVASRASSYLLLSVLSHRSHV